MNRNLFIILTILIVPLCVYFALDKYQYVFASKVDTSRPTVIKFSSELCGECQKMQRVIDEVYPKYQSKINMVNVNVQKRNPETKKLIKEYKVSLIPTMIFKNSKNVVVIRQEGSMSAQKFEECLKGIINE